MFELTRERERERERERGWKKKINNSVGLRDGEMKGGEGNEKEGTTIRLWRIHRDLFRLSTARHPLNCAPNPPPLLFPASFNFRDL